MADPKNKVVYVCSNCGKRKPIGGRQDSSPHELNIDCSRCHGDNVFRRQGTPRAGTLPSKLV